MTLNDKANQIFPGMEDEGRRSVALEVVGKTTNTLRNPISHFLIFSSDFSHRVYWTLGFFVRVLLAFWYCEPVCYLRLRCTLMHTVHQATRPHLRGQRSTDRRIINQCETSLWESSTRFCSKKVNNKCHKICLKFQLSGCKYRLSMIIRPFFFDVSVELLLAGKQERLFILTKHWHQMCIFQVKKIGLWGLDGGSMQRPLKELGYLISPTTWLQIS